MTDFHTLSRTIYITVADHDPRFGWVYAGDFTDTIEDAATAASGHDDYRVTEIDLDERGRHEASRDVTDDVAALLDQRAVARGMPTRAEALADQEAAYLREIRWDAA